jgi:hypothetical protein
MKFHRPALPSAVSCWVLLCGTLAGNEPAPKGRLTAEELHAREVQANDDPVALLLLLPLADDQNAGRLRKQVHDLLNEMKVPAAEQAKLAARLAAVLPETVRSMDEARQVFGPPRQTARQIFFRRYAEEWSFDSPLPLCLVFDCRTGQVPRLQTVRVNRPQKM